jgi:hypothetical protein
MEFWIVARKFVVLTRVPADANLMHPMVVETLFEGMMKGYMSTREYKTSLASTASEKLAGWPGRWIVDCKSFVTTF